jgi:hypothetical protein
VDEVKLLILASAFLLSFPAFSVCEFDFEKLKGEFVGNLPGIAKEVEDKGCLDLVLEKSLVFPKIAEVDAFQGALELRKCGQTCVDADFKKIKELAESSCEKGFQDICFELKLKKDKKFEIVDPKYARKYCDLNSAYACHALGLQMNKDKPKSGMIYIKKACDLKNKNACKLVSG